MSTSDLLSLAGAPDLINLPEIWRRLPDVRKRTIVRSASTMPPDSFRALRLDVARRRSIRQRTAEAWTLDQFVDVCLRARLTPQILHALLVAYHVDQRRPLMQQFLDGVGVPNSEGIVAGGAIEAALTAAPSAQVEGTVAACLDSRDPADVSLYLLVLWVLHPGARHGLDVALRALASQHPAGGEPTERRDEAVLSGTPPEETDTPEDEVRVGFTTLDKVLIRKVIDCAEGIVGAPEEDQLEDLLLEVQQLNSERHQSYFHLGFHDGLFGRTYRTPGVGTNAARQRWYAAGWVTALARRNEQRAIVRLFDEQPAVQLLGRADGPDGFAVALLTASLVIDALCEHERGAEASRFVDATVLRASAPAAQRLEAQATHRLRTRRPDIARVIFDRLAEAVPLASTALDQSGFWRRVHRRRANACRQLGELETARQALEVVLAKEDAPVQRHRILADLGLIAAGYRNLADVQLPDRQEQCHDVLQALHAGRERFEEARRAAPDDAGHAQFCLGVIAMLEDDSARAVDLLGQAYAAFRAERTVYAIDGLLARATLYFGVALCRSGAAGEQRRRAALLIVNALQDGAAMPSFLVEEVLLAFMADEGEEVRTLVELLLRQRPEELEILLAMDEAQRSSAIGDAVIDRIRDRTRGVHERARLARAGFALLRAQDRFDEAAEALDVIEEAARIGLEPEWLLAFLDDPSHHEPVWSHDEAMQARVHLLATQERMAEAIAVLRGEFFRVVYSGTDGLMYAYGLLEQIEQFEAAIEGSEHGAQLRAVLSACGGEPTTVRADEPGRRLRILVVGGDERQAGYEAPIHAELAETQPFIDVEFLRTGWSSNWAADAETVLRRVRDGVDAVVLLTFMRTTLGRTLRANLGTVPWRACTGHGRESIKRAILTAAAAAASGTA